MPNQKCPLCNSDAEYEIFHDPYCKHFTCPICVEFCIDANSEAFVNNESESSRRKLSIKAKEAKQKHMLVLRAPTDDEIKSNPQQKLKIIGEFIATNI